MEKCIQEVWFKFIVKWCPMPNYKLQIVWITSQSNVFSKQEILMYNYTDKKTESKYILLTLQNGQKVQVTYRKKK